MWVGVRGLSRGVFEKKGGGFFFFFVLGGGGGGGLARSEVFGLYLLYFVSK